ncbi:MAG TPA: type IV pilus secretin PilQ [Rhodanobacteraceae bacterium]|nr:type IV pilus secretin PilQ [Rhodanobacteraceae bacterium]
MIMRPAHHNGRTDARPDRPHGTPVKAPGRKIVAIVALLGAIACVPAFAANTLQDVSSSALPDGQVQLTLKFAQPIVAPRAFSTDTPPRIALDFADTHNGMSQRSVAVNGGSATSVTAVEANGRTRVVVDLSQPSAYVTRVDGNDLIVTVGNGMNMAAAPAAAQAQGAAVPLAPVPAPPPSQIALATAATDPSKAMPMASGNVIETVDFSRGDGGAGKLVIGFDAPGAATSIHNEGDHVFIDVLGARLAASQARRLDASDYATPVKSISTHATPGGARIDVLTNGLTTPSGYQSGNQYVVEFAPPKQDLGSVIGAPKAVVYKGGRVTFNFQDIPVRSVLQLLADVSGTNIVASDSVQGNVTLRLVNVPWDQALAVILRAKNLDQRKDGNVIWVAPQQELASYEQNIADARLKELENAPLVSDYIPISYGNAADIAKLLTSQTKTNSAGGGGGQQQRGFLSSRGSVSFDERTNTLLVNDTPEKVQEIRQLVAVLDKPVQQVLIEARIVIATDNFARDLGAKFGLDAFGYSGNQQVLAGPTLNDVSSLNKSTVAQQTVIQQNAINQQAACNAGNCNSFTPTLVPGITYPSGLNFSAPASAAGGIGSFAVGIISGHYMLDLELSAAQTEGRSETISSPKVITANQQEALIQQGQEIGYVTYQNSSGGGGTNGTATVQFKDAVLELRVTPTITADDRVFMKLKVTKDAINSFVPNPGGGLIPQLDKREVDTSVLVDNGQTVVLGGVYEFTKSIDTVKVPFLGDVPVLGALFRHKNNQNNKAQLLIFVTPRILNQEKMVE